MWQGKTEFSEKTYPSAALSTIDTTWLYPGLNPANNRLPYGTAPVAVKTAILRRPETTENE
jgi:hypothetical protein